MAAGSQEMRNLAEKFAFKDGNRIGSDAYYQAEGYVLTPEYTNHLAKIESFTAALDFTRLATYLAEAGDVTKWMKAN